MNWELIFKIVVVVGIAQIVWVLTGIHAELKQLTRKGEGGVLDRLAHILRHELVCLEDRWASGEAHERAALGRKLDDYAEMADGIIAAAERNKTKKDDRNS